MEWKEMATQAANAVVKHSPEILTGLGISGMITATVLAVKSTPEALRRIGKRKRELNVFELPKTEVVKTCWKCYIPTAITTFVSAGCLVGANTINHKRNAVLASAYALTETAFKDYKTAVQETLTERETVKINDKVAENKVKAIPVSDDNVISTGTGNTLFLDLTCGRYWRSDINYVKQAVNTINERLLNETFISKNEFYAELGLDPVTDGYELGWDVTNGLIHVDYSTQISTKGEPCITINYLSSPLTKYRH